jgi:2'-5' RNA ligase
MAYKLGKTKAPHEFSSTQVDLPDDVAAKVRELGRKIADDDLAEDGRETEPHVTVKYGLHADKASAELKRLVGGFGHAQAKLGKTSLFENGEADVVKLEVASHDLHRLNKKIAGAEDHTDTHPGYTPHVTLAYVKKGRGKKYAGDATLAGHPITFDHIVFSAKDRSKQKLPLGKYSLR